MHPVLNDTKWDELRLAMYRLGGLSPRWRTKDLYGYLCPWDAEWFYHFRGGGYASIEWVEIEITSPEQEAAVLASLRPIHVPGRRTEDGFRVYGYVSGAEAVEFL